MANTFKLIIAMSVAATPAACGDSDLERGLSGAAAGAVAADVTDNDVGTGALIGGAAGVLCDDLTPQLCR